MVACAHNNVFIRQHLISSFYIAILRSFASSACRNIPQQKQKKNIPQNDNMQAWLSICDGKIYESQLSSSIHVRYKIVGKVPQLPFAALCYCSNFVVVENNFSQQLNLMNNRVHISHNRWTTAVEDRQKRLEVERTSKQN